MANIGPGCDQCGGLLNPTYPLRLVSADSREQTKVRRICPCCIGTSLYWLKVASATCPGCVVLCDVFQRLAEGIRDAGERDEAVIAVVVPPNRTPHNEGCQYAHNDVVKRTAPVPMERDQDVNYFN